MIKRLFKSPLLRNNILYSGSSFFFRLFNTLLMFSIAARIFTVGQFGLLSLFITIIMVTYTALDFGHRIKIVKDVAANQSNINAVYLGNKVWLKMLLFCLSTVLLVSYAYWKDFWEYHKVVTVFLLLAGLFKGLTNLYFAIFQGVHLFKEETKSLAFFSLGVAMVLGLCVARPSIAIFVFGYMMVSLAQLCYTHFLAVQSIEGFSLQKVSTPFEWRAIRKELGVGIVFASIVIVEILFSSFDSFYVENQYSKLDLGYYEAFKKIFLGLNVFAMILAVALFPEISKRLERVSKEAINFLLKALGLMLGVGIVVLGGYVLFNHWIVNLVLGEQYLKLTTWDSHIALITLASYVRVVPNLYFVSSGNEMKRFILTGLFVLVELGCFIYFLRDSVDIRQAIKILTYIHVGLTIFSFSVFAFLLDNQRRQIVRNSLH